MARFPLATPLGRLMAARNITIVQLCAATGLNDKTIRNYLAGRRQPDHAELVRLARALRVPPSRINPHARMLQLEVPSSTPLKVQDPAP